MKGTLVWHGHPTLSRPLTVLGVERRWFFLSLTLGLALWNAINSIVTGGVIFFGLYLAGWLAWKRDPNMLSIVAADPTAGPGTTAGSCRSGLWSSLNESPAERREYEAAGSLADELPYWGWLGEDVGGGFPCCLTRSGELFAAAPSGPRRHRRRTPDQLDQVLNRWQRLLSALDPQTRVYFYLFRRPGELAEIEGLEGVAAISQEKRRTFLLDRVQGLQAYVVWSHDPQLQSVGQNGTDGGRWWLDTAKNWMRRKGNRDQVAFLFRHVREAADAFRQLVDASCALATDVTPLTILDAVEGNAFLSELVNRPGVPWHGGGTGSALNWRLALSELEAERRFLRLDGEPVILYSLLGPPTQARANLLADLYRLDADLTVALEWRPYTLEAARRKIRSAQRHYFQRRYSMMAHVQETEGTTSAMLDSAADVESSRLGGALVELEANGVAYGDVALTVALHGELRKIEQLDAELRRIFGGCDAKLIREGYGQLPAWFGRMPAQPRKRQVRSVFASAGVPLASRPSSGPPLRHPSVPTCGGRRSPSWRRPGGPHTTTTSSAGDVGHTLILGATGSGKSFLLNFLLVQSLQYRPRVLVLDLGGSYRWLTQFLGGGYLSLTPETAASGQPRCGRSPCRLGSAPSASSRLALAPAADRRLRAEGRGYHRAPRTGRGHLRSPGRGSHSHGLRAGPPPEDVARDVPLARRGRVGPFFDNAGPDTLDLQDWQVIDLAGAAEHEDLCEAALFYLLERLRLALDADDEAERVKLMVVDEAWRYLSDPSVLAYLAEAAKTWRKRNAALVLATQSAGDVTATPGPGGSSSPCRRSSSSRIRIFQRVWPTPSGSTLPRWRRFGVSCRSASSISGEPRLRAYSGWRSIPRVTGSTRVPTRLGPSRRSRRAARAAWGADRTLNPRKVMTIMLRALSLLALFCGPLAPHSPPRMLTFSAWRAIPTRPSSSLSPESVTPPLSPCRLGRTSSISWSGIPSTGPSPDPPTWPSSNPRSRALRRTSLSYANPAASTPSSLWRTAPLPPTSSSALTVWPAPISVASGGASPLPTAAISPPSWRDRVWRASRRSPSRPA